jgi:hypothetical protein
LGEACPVHAQLLIARVAFRTTSFGSA